MMAPFYEVKLSAVDTSILINNKHEALEDLATNVFNHLLHSFSGNGLPIN